MFVLRHLIDSHVKQNRKQIFAAFIDFEKAFDTVWRDALLYKLLKAGIHGRMFNMIKSMYEETYYSVKCKDGLTTFFKSISGVRQGCNLSPILFNLFINDIEKLFEDIEGFKIGSKNLKFLLYADDLLILCKSQSDLQLSVSRLHKYTQKWGLTINVSKSKVIVFSKYRRKNYKIFVNGTILEQVDSYTYLGVDFHRTGNLKHASLSLSKKGMKATNSLLKVLLTKNLPPNMLIKLFDQTIVPILTYASEIWGTFSLQSKTVFDDFGNLTPEKQYLKTDTERTCLYFYKRLLMVNKNTSNLATLGELGRYPIHIIIIIRIIKFWYRINELEENSLLKETLNEQLRAQNTNKNQWIDFVNQILNSLNIEKCFSGNTVSNINDLTKKLTIKLQERFVKFWRRGIWSSNSVNNNPNGNKLRIYCHFKKSFVIESYLTFVKNPSHRKAFCQLRTSSHSLMCEVGRFTKLPYDQRTCLFCPSKQVESELHFMFECQLYNDLRAGSIIENAILTNQHLSPLRCFFSFLSTHDISVLRQLAKYLYNSFEKRKKSDMYSCLKNSC